MVRMDASMSIPEIHRNARAILSPFYPQRYQHDFIVILKNCYSAG